MLSFMVFELSLEMRFSADSLCNEIVQVDVPWFFVIRLQLAGDGGAEIKWLRM